MHFITFRNMKTNFFRLQKLVVFSLIFIMGKINGLYAQGAAESDIYCTAYAGCNIYISSVIINNQIINPSGCGTNGYGNFVSQVVSLGTSQTFEVTVSTSGASANSICKMWIDWNMDADFTDEGEVFIVPNTGQDLYMTAVTVPSDAFTGYTRIRIRFGQNNLNPCGYIAQGETEDYTASIHNVLSIDSVSSIVFCGGGSMEVFCNQGLVFNEGNHFIVQLSDTSGSFVNATLIGDLAEINSGSISCLIPLNIITGSTYKIRVITTNPPVTSDEYPVPLTLYTPPDLQVTSPLHACIPNSADLTTSFIDINNTEGSVTYWLDPDCIIPVANPHEIFQQGLYYIKKTATTGGCIDVVALEIIFNDAPLVDAGPDSTLAYGECVTLLASCNGGNQPYTYNWSPAAGLSAQNVLQPIACPSVTTVYYLSAIDQLGCVGTDSTSIQVLSSGSGNLSGTVRYDNADLTPLSNVLVELHDNNNEVYTTITDSTGYYEFLDVPTGDYSILCSSSSTWNGGNAVDALLVMKHFTGLENLTGIRLLAADVNNTSTINAIDALLIMRRFVSLISSFDAGDWIFEDVQPVIYSGCNLQIELKGICTGDVNGSNIPAK